jgi:choline dehydrogenase-like flavoprotein
MLIDARNLPENENLETDVCIVGSGAAGLSLAKEFAGAQFKVVVLEGGGLKFEHRSQFLHRGTNHGRAYWPLEVTHRRQLGGSTAVWFGRCRPLDPMDFESRSWIPHSGWPFSKSELDPFYDRAWRLCEVDPGDAAEDSEALRRCGLESRPFYFSPPTHFGQAYLPELRRAANLRVVVHANAVRIDLEADGSRVSQIRCATLNRKTFSVTARIFILAAGGLETPRLLLVSNKVHAAGVGNQNDVVGRFFQEHVYCFSAAATFVPGDFPPDYFRLNYETFQRNLEPTPAIGLPASLHESEHMLNAAAFFVQRPVYKTDDRFYSRRVKGFLHLSETIRHSRPHSRETVNNVLDTITNLPTLLGLGQKAIAGKLSSVHEYAIHVQSESIPNRQSRVILSEARDALGMNQICLDWRLSAQDRDSFTRFETHLQRGLQKGGFQIRAIQHDVEADGWPVFTSGSKHHMGATRMSLDPRQGVVDGNCRVHGLGNLFIASSSVFPTSGMANPTLTIVALAIRLADHIKQILA